MSNPLAAKKMGPGQFPYPAQGYAEEGEEKEVRELSVTEQLTHEREALTERLAQIDATLSLLERNPEFELILTEVKKVIRRP